MVHLSDALVQVTRPMRALDSGGTRLGTGFWFATADEAVLVTADHVVRGARRIRVGDGHGGWVDGRVRRRHPDDAVDLAILDVAGPSPVAFMERAWIPTGEARASLESVEPVLVLGHPLGLVDPVHPRPIVRSGVTATDPRLPWRGEAAFLVDVPCHPGTSGSPVIGYRPGDDVPVRLLGVLVGGPALRDEARVGVLADWPVGDTFHLGTAVDARRLLEMA